MQGIEIISIGSEILSGFTINTNAAWIGKKLLEAGFQVDLQTVIPDEKEVLLKTFNEALKRSKLVIITGGLGPTLDDITKDAISEFFGLKLYYNEEIAKNLVSKFGNLPIIENQATVPEKAILINNSVGTAPGFIFTRNETTTILLPGVPKEMKAMMDETVISYLKEHFKEFKKKYVRTLYLYKLYEKDVDPLLVALKKEYKVLDFGIYPHEGYVAVVLHSNEESLLNSVEEKIHESFKDNVLDFKGGKIEEALLEAFTKKNKRLSLAESCTGGRMAAKLTGISGSSNYFLGSIVSYANSVKNHLLLVPDEILKAEGAVSKKCVREMALNALKLMKSDYAVAVSGIAGPEGGTEEKPVGTVFGAIATKKDVRVMEYHFLGGRDAVMESSCNFLLFELYQELQRN